MTITELPTTLNENEFFLKIRHIEGQEPVGFLTKYNKNGTIPIQFSEWKSSQYGGEELPIIIHNETYQPGWKLTSWRYGKSQNWARVLHPNGFIIEIYLDNFLEIIEKNIIANGYICGRFKWTNHTLVKE